MTSRKMAEKPRPGRRGALAKVGIVRYPLFDASLEDPDCAWIDMQTELTYGDQQALAGAIFNSLQLGGDESLNEDALSIKLDVAYDGPAKILAWVVDWNLEDEEGARLSVDMETILALASVYAKEIHRVIDRHVEENNLGTPTSRAPRDQSRRAKK